MTKISLWVWRNWRSHRRGGEKKSLEKETLEIPSSIYVSQPGSQKENTGVQNRITYGVMSDQKRK